MSSAGEIEQLRTDADVFLERTCTEDCNECRECRRCRRAAQALRFYADALEAGAAL